MAGWVGKEADTRRFKEASNTRKDPSRGRDRQAAGAERTRFGSASLACKVLLENYGRFFRCTRRNAASVLGSLRFEHAPSTPAMLGPSAALFDNKSLAQHLCRPYRTTLRTTASATQGRENTPSFRLHFRPKCRFCLVFKQTIALGAKLVFGLGRHKPWLRGTQTPKK